jgi:hypothetical protein
VVKFITWTSITPGILLDALIALITISSNNTTTKNTEQCINHNSEKNKHIRSIFNQMHDTRLASNSLFA